MRWMVDPTTSLKTKNKIEKLNKNKFSLKSSHNFCLTHIENFSGKYLIQSEYIPKQQNNVVITWPQC